MVQRLIIAVVAVAFIAMLTGCAGTKIEVTAGTSQLFLPNAASVGVSGSTGANAKLAGGEAQLARLAGNTGDANATSDGTDALGGADQQVIAGRDISSNKTIDTEATLSQLKDAKNAAASQASSAGQSTQDQKVDDSLKPTVNVPVTGNGASSVDNKPVVEAPKE